MSKAFVETTIVANSLLKNGQIAKTAKDALKRFDSTELPVYAIKEFKAGPLKNFKWFHNKLALHGSFGQALAALHSMSLTPKKYTTSTAIEALQVAYQNSKTSNGLLQTKYGVAADPDRSICDQYRLTLKAKIFTAWKRRRLITTSVVIPLSCFNETGPYEQEDHQIVIENLRCSVDKECCLAPTLRQRLSDLEKLRAASLKQTLTAENVRRIRALKEIIKRPKGLVSEKTCRDLGDAWFALFAPQDEVILTTNIKGY